MEGQSRNKRSNAFRLILTSVIIIVIILLIMAFVMTPAIYFKDETGPTIIFQDDFEHSNYTPVEGYPKGNLDGLLVGDDSFKNDSAWDWWGVTDYRYHPGNGNHSLWCAQYGDNAANGNVSNRLIHKYDQEMIAYWEALFNLSNYDRVALDFWYWSETNYNATSDQPYDYFTVMVWNGTGVNGTGFSKIWKQSINHTWTHVIIDIPTNMKLIGFYFWRATYMDHPLLEGAYVDDVILTGHKNPIPEHPIKIVIKNTNSPNFYYGGNPSSNGGLPVNITLNGDVRKLVFLMPAESTYFFISTDDLPIVLILESLSGTKTYRLDNDTAFENSIYSYTVHSTPIY